MSRAEETERGFDTTKKEKHCAHKRPTESSGSRDPGSEGKSTVAKGTETLVQPRLLGTNDEARKSSLARALEPVAG